MTKARNISKGQGVTQENATASTSGTTIDYDVPAGTLRITVIFDGTSLTSGLSRFLIQLGTSGGIQTTGYTSRSVKASGSTSNSSGFVINTTDSTEQMIGTMVITNVTDNIWASTHVGFLSVAYETIYGAGRVSLSDEITQLRITKSGGGTFDNGYVNLLFG